MNDKFQSISDNIVDQYYTSIKSKEIKSEQNINHFTNQMENLTYKDQIDSNSQINDQNNLNDMLSSNIWDFNKKDDNEEFNEKMKTLMDRKDNKLVNYGTKEWNSSQSIPRVSIKEFLSNEKNNLKITSSDNCENSYTNFNIRKEGLIIENEENANFYLKNETLSTNQFNNMTKMNSGILENNSNINLNDFSVKKRSKPSIKINSTLINTDNANKNFTNSGENRNSYNGVSSTNKNLKFPSSPNNLIPPILNNFHYSPQYQYMKINPFNCMKIGQSNLDDEANLINLENILRRIEKRTTIMIRNIPNKYNLNTFLDELDKEFKNKYDVFYLPIDYQNKCNLGFAFINFVDSMHIILFYDLFRGKKWKKFKSEKICELAYAKFQGKKELIRHFEKGSVLNVDSDDKKPVIKDILIYPKIEIPLKYLDAFKIIYPFSYVYIRGDRFFVE